MNTKAVSIPGISATSIGLGILAALLVFVVLTDRKIPLISNDRVALVVLVLLGIAMCTNGIGRVADAGAWLHPLAILGYLLGALILLLGAAALFGLQMPLVTDVRQAIIAISVLGVAKLVFSALHRLIWM